MADFKPNIYPIMYWALFFGLIAGLLLFIVSILAKFIYYFWFPVFLGGLVWGGYRNYQKQKSGWAGAMGVTSPPKPVAEEFKEAASDIVAATREMLQERPLPSEDENQKQQQPPV